MSSRLNQSINQKQIEEALPAAIKPESTITKNNVFKFTEDDLLDHISKHQNYIRTQQLLHISTQRRAVCYHRAQINQAIYIVITHNNMFYM